MKNNKLSKSKAAEMLHNPPHGKKLTEKQRKYFGAIANAQMGISVIDPNEYITSSNPKKTYGNTSTFKNKAEHDEYHRLQLLEQSKGTNLYDEYLKYGVNQVGVNDKADALLMAMGGIPAFTPMKQPKKQTFSSRILDIDYKPKKTQGYRYSKSLPDKESITPISYQSGGIIEDNMGQLKYPGEVTKINSNNITMKGVNYPVLGISDTNDKKMMYPGEDYKFDGNNVTEYPIMKSGGRLKEYQSGGNLPPIKNQLEDLYLLNALRNERQQKRDSMRYSLYDKFPNQSVKVSKGMTDYYRTEPREYLQLDINLLDDTRKKQLLKGYNKNFQYGGEINYPEWGSNQISGFGNSDIYSNNNNFPSWGSQEVSGFGDSNIGGFENTNQPRQNLYGRIGGIQGVAQGIGAVGYGMQETGPGQTEGGPSGAQKAVSQFGPWGQVISQVSQIGTNITDKSNNKYVYTAGKSILDPASAWTNKDLSKRDRILGGLNPIYGGIKAHKAKKDRERKEKLLGDLVKRAGESQDVNANKRRYVRPEDQLVDPNELFSSYGTGTNYLKHGGNVPYMERGGELKTYWGGEAESISENPYLPGNGETIMFKGKSHENGGIGMKFGNSSVEVESGEPAVKLPDGNKESLVVFGDMKIPSYGVSELMDSKAKGKKFKNYINQLSKTENKQNKIVEKGLKLVNNTEVLDSFDKLKVSSGTAMIEGGNMKLKEIAAKKQIAANIQNAILETAEELGLKSNELAKGKFKKAKMGKKIEYAQEGGRYTIPKSQMDEYQMYGYRPDPEDINRMYRDLRSSETTSTIPVTLPGQGSEEFNRAFAEARRQNIPTFTWKGNQYTTDLFQGNTKTVTNPGRTNRDYIYLEDDYITLPEQEQSLNQGISTMNRQIPRERSNIWNDLMTVGNSILPFIRPSNQIPLDPNQLSGEMYALATNQQDPVQAQQYQPLLENVSDISLQDQLNANQADFNAIQRYTAQNPAAQATLAAQKYQANTSVLGEQFRLNQAQKMGVYNRNRGVLNDATLKNLAILDQQFVRQSQAKSNTKAVAQQAINSIADKIAKNKLENRTLGVYENLYNYRYDNKGRAWNWNGFAQFNVDNNIVDVDENGKVVMDESKVKRDRNGMIINSTDTRRMTDKKRNGGIVKAIKSL